MPATRFLKKLFLVALLLVYVPSSVLALSPEQKRVIDSGIYYFDVKGNAICGTSGQTSETLSDNVPTVWKNLIEQAAGEYPDVNPNVVAAQLWIENRGWPEYKTSGWATSGAAAQGPWQFIPDTWASMGTDGNGDGVASPDDPADAVHAAFKHNLGSAGLPLMVGYSGSPEDAFNTIPFEREATNLLYYIAKYNGSGAPDGATLASFPRRENADYVVMGFWLLATDFDQGYVFDEGLVDAFTYNNRTGESTGEGISAGGQCGGLGVGPDGFVFPVLTAKSVIDGSQNSPGTPYAVWCKANCHNSPPAWAPYLAHDIGAPKGTPIVASAGGIVQQVRSSSGQLSLHIEGDDGFWYFYQHLDPATVEVEEGESVTDGQVVGTIGPVAINASSGGTAPPHVHFSVGTEQLLGSARGCSPSSCPNIDTMVDVLEQLLSAYENLPEG